MHVPSVLVTSVCAVSLAGFTARLRIFLVGWHRIMDGFRGNEVKQPAGGAFVIFGSDGPSYLENGHNFAQNLTFRKNMRPKVSPTIRCR